MCLPMTLSERKIGATTLSLTVLAVAITLSICCEDLNWQCRSGQCIPVEQVCDGVADCFDSSDEMSELCSQQSCPPFAFRCAYGACVPGAARCNETKECADNSDEDSLLCNTVKTPADFHCVVGEFECKSGYCISQYDACDGKIECPDKFDESEEACSSNFCSALFFRCGYGACIRLDAKCNGINDCWDGSDENVLLCGNTDRIVKEESIGRDRPPPWQNPRVINEPKVSTEISTIDPSNDEQNNRPRPPPVSSAKTCTAPIIPNSRIITESTHMRVIKPGDQVPNMRSIVYHCQSGFYREGQDYNFCLNGAWISTIHPICTRYCPHETLDGVTFNVKCSLNGDTVSCKERIKPGTVVKVTCPTKYRVPDRNPTQTLFCEENGQWDYPPSRCEPICGEDIVPSVPFLVNGQVTNITMVPWHVGIYERVADTYKHRCGGSIISAKIIITAAHCFWDNANENIYDKSLYLIGAGKIFRDYYNKDETRKTQFQNVSQIYVPTDFKGPDAKYRADIAVVVLVNPLVFSEFVAPICIRWQMSGAKSIASGSYGQVAGWGIDESGTYSDKLKTIYIPGSSYEICKNEAGPWLSESITEDKFCVLNKFNTNACQGDSGGGFAVKNVIGGKNRHFLWGVVSTGVPIGVTCSNFQFVSYTNIQFYETFVTDIETRNRPK